MQFLEAIAVLSLCWLVWLNLPFTVIARADSPIPTLLRAQSAPDHHFSRWLAKFAALLAPAQTKAKSLHET